MIMCLISISLISFQLTWFYYGYCVPWTEVFLSHTRYFYHLLLIAVSLLHKIMLRVWQVSWLFIFSDCFNSSQRSRASWTLCYFYSWFFENFAALLGIFSCLWVDQMRLALDFGLCELFWGAWKVLVYLGRGPNVGVAEIVTFIFKDAYFLFNFFKLHHNIVSCSQAFSFNLDTNKIAHKTTFFNLLLVNRRSSIFLRVVLFFKRFVLLFQLFYLLFKGLYFSN